MTLSMLSQAQADTGVASPGAGDPVSTTFWCSVAALQNWIAGLTGLSHEAQGKIFLSFLAVFCLYVLRRLVMRVVDRRVNDPKLVYQWSKGSSQVARPRLAARRASDASGPRRSPASRPR